ncbi:MAG: aquaporin [Chlamydiae bacterium RIFCSPHIGHO2_12_FULL_49_9]|nr:MAG: aquaporin [Chlamydiae bacterium RIFCSPHIGHO2_12_FULL_49_9]
MNIFLAELVGTLILILLGNGVVANVLLSHSKGEKGGWIVITAGWGFAVAIAVYAIGWISGGHINPAVTVGLCVAGKTPFYQAPLYIGGQMLGAMLGSILVYITYLPHWGPTKDSTTKLLCFCTHPAIKSPLSNFLTEVIATAVLLVGILGIFNIHNGIGSGFGPYAVGILIFSIGLSLGGPTGFAINPARDLGPRIMHSWIPMSGKRDSEWSYAWIPVVGPIVGAVLGVWFYQMFIEKLMPVATL